MGFFSDYLRSRRNQGLPLVATQSQQTGQDRQATLMPVQGTLRDRSVLFNPERFWGVPAGGGDTVATDGTGGVDTSNAIGSLAEILGPTPAEREARERRALEHKGKMSAWSGLFDGLRQLGNLYFTAHGATPQVYGDVYGQIDRQYEAARQRQDMSENYRRQYALQKQQLERQAEQDRMAHEKHQAEMDYYRQRDQLNAEKVAIQRFNAEANAAYREAKLDLEKKKVLEIQQKLAEGRISLMEAQEQLARVKAAQGGFAPKQGQEGTETVVTEGYDNHDNKVKTTVRRPIGGGGKQSIDGFGGSRSGGKQRIEGFGGR